MLINRRRFWLSHFYAAFWTSLLRTYRNQNFLRNDDFFNLIQFRLGLRVVWKNRINFNYNGGSIGRVNCRNTWDAVTTDERGRSVDIFICCNLFNLSQCLLSAQFEYMQQMSNCQFIRLQTFKQLSTPTSVPLNGILWI